MTARGGVDLEEVVEASNGAEALAALQGSVVDLILCDINMPVMDGLELVRQVGSVESAKGVDVVILGHAPTDVPFARAAIQAQTPSATPATTKTTQPSPLAPPKPTVVSTTGGRLQQ